MNPSQKVALVTGSTSGIGKATAIRLAQNGFIVIANSFEENPKESLQLENITYIKADISKRSDLESLRDQIKEKFGKLDYLVANAGIIPLPCGIDDITEENLGKTVDVNLKGTFWTLKILGKLIQETSDQGAIVALTSVDGIIGEPYNVIYSATKAGIISLTKSFARYYKDPLVRVNAVAPGLINTPLSKSTGEDPSQTTDFSIIQRMGEAKEIADTINYLLSPESSFITGQVVAVDGGFTLK
jgi:3-oxoacyl-[acyl-carrier protein] reductase